MYKNLMKRLINWEDTMIVKLKLAETVLLSFVSLLYTFLHQVQNCPLQKSYSALNQNSIFFLIFECSAAIHKHTHGRVMSFFLFFLPLKHVH